MSAGQILDEWLADGQKPRDKAKDPRDYLAGLKPVSLGGRADYTIGKELARLRGTKFEFKYHAWGFYKPHELEELLTMARIDAVRQLITDQAQKTAPADIAEALNISQTQLAQNKKLSGNMADFFLKGPAV